MKTTRKTISVLLSVLLALLMLAPLGAVSFAAEEEAPEDEIVTVVESGDCGAEGSDVRYTLYSNGLMIVEGTGAIRESAFRGREDFSALRVENDVTAIGKSAFRECYHLKSIALADTVKTVEEGAFIECVNLDTIAFGNGLESIGQWAFMSIAAFRQPVILPDSVKTLANESFEYTDFKWFVFGAGVEFAESGVLYCTCVTDLVFLNKNTLIGEDNNGTLTGMDLQWRPRVYSIAGGNVEAYANAHSNPFIDVTTIEETAHDWNEGTVTKLPTCTEPGEITYLCKTNPTHRKTEAIPVTGHMYLETVTHPTCGEAGSKTRTCVLCGKVETEPIPATGEHTWDAGVYTVYPTETTPGEIVYTCTSCGFENPVEVPATPYQDWLYTESNPTGNGQIGEHVYYTTYYDGHISIYGTGDTYPVSHYVPYDYYYHPIGGNPTSIEVHEGVTGLMCKGMFCNYPQLEYVKLPASLTYIESMVFDTIQVLTAVDVAAANPSYTSQNGILFNKDMTELLLYPSGKTENSYTVPDGVEIIGEMAFHKNPVLKTVTLPDSVKEIGNTAFNSSVLETVNLGYGLETIDNYAFSNCKALESIRIPTSVRSIGNGVFKFDDNFKNVYYDCPQEAWDKIELGTDNDILLNADFVYGEHAYNDGEITTPATCGKAGVKTFTCSKCGNAYTETIPATGAHTYEGVITTPATCGADGVKTFTCQNCGNSYTETIPATGAHAYSSVITTPATCEADGVKTFTCAGCDDSYTETIPATGHNWGEWVVTKMATEDEEGLAVRTCQNDPTHKETKTIDKLPPTFEEEENIFVRMFHWIEEFFQRIGEAFRNLFSIFD